VRLKVALTTRQRSPLRTNSRSHLSLRSFFKVTSRRRPAARSRSVPSRSTSPARRGLPTASPQRVDGRVAPAMRSTGAPSSRAAPERERLGAHLFSRPPTTRPATRTRRARFTSRARSRSEAGPPMPPRTAHRSTRSRRVSRQGGEQPTRRPRRAGAGRRRGPACSHLCSVGDEASRSSVRVIVAVEDDHVLDRDCDVRSPHRGGSGPGCRNKSASSTARAPRSPMARARSTVAGGVPGSRAAPRARTPAPAGARASLDAAGYV